MDNTDVGHLKAEEQQQPQNLPDDSIPESAATSGLSKNLVNEDELKATYAMDTPVRSIICQSCLLYQIKLNDVFHKSCNGIFLVNLGTCSSSQEGLLNCLGGSDGINFRASK